jgi:hypothetical protein
MHRLSTIADATHLHEEIEAMIDDLDQFHGAIISMLAPYCRHAGVGGAVRCLSGGEMERDYIGWLTHRLAKALRARRIHITGSKIEQLIKDFQDPPSNFLKQWAASRQLPFTPPTGYRIKGTIHDEIVLEKIPNEHQEWLAKLCLPQKIQYCRDMHNPQLDRFTIVWRSCASAGLCGVAIEHYHQMVRLWWPTTDLIMRAKLRDTKYSGNHREMDNLIADYNTAIRLGLVESEWILK